MNRFRSWQTLYSSRPWILSNLVDENQPIPPSLKPVWPFWHWLNAWVTLKSNVWLARPRKKGRTRWQIISFISLLHVNLFNWRYLVYNIHYTNRHGTKLKYTINLNTVNSEIILNYFSSVIWAFYMFTINLCDFLIRCQD